MPKFWLICLAIPFAIPGVSCLSQQDERAQHLSAPNPISVKEEAAARHLEGDWPDIRLSPAESGSYRPFQGLRFTLTVSAQGNVVEATPEGVGDEKQPPAGVDLGEKVVLGLKFIPFARGGQNVPARFSFYIPVYPAEEIPDKHVPFPKLNDRATLIMTLGRFGCYGTCPVYSVKVYGDGKVEYEGQCFVAVHGKRSSMIPGDAVESLFEYFKNADYFSLKDDYDSLATDLPTFTTSIAFDGQTKSVTDYFGVEMGMPDSVKLIERTIDRVTNSLQWVNKNGTWKPSKKESCR